MPEYPEEERLVFVGRLAEEEVEWLAKFSVIKPFEEDRYDPKEVQCLPCVDDFRLATTDIEEMLNRCLKYAEKMRAVPGFKSATLERYEQILREALTTKCHLVAYCD